MEKICSGVFILSFIVFSACNQPSKPKAFAQIAVETPVVKEEPKMVIQPIEIKYHFIRMKDSSKKVFDSYDEEKQALILALNRIDKSNLWRADTLIVPDTFITDRNAYSVFPLKIAALRKVNKMVFFSYPTQTYGIYENGNLLKWGPTSMGKKSSKTPTGLFFTNWKGKEIHSTVNDEWVLKWNFNVMNKFGVGWHQYAMPGFPASHSCMRLYADDAKFLYDWADQWILKKGQLVANGTPVLIFGAYPFGGRKPWFNLLDNPDALKISEEKMNELIQPHLQKILEEQARSEELRAIKVKDTTQAIIQ